MREEEENSTPVRWLLQQYQWKMTVVWTRVVVEADRCGQIADLADMGRRTVVSDGK